MKPCWEVDGLTDPTSNKATASDGSIRSEDQSFDFSNSSNNPFIVEADADGSGRFGLLALLLSMVIFAAAAAAGAQMLELVRQGTTPRAAFAMFTLMAPVVLVTFVSVGRSVAIWIRDRT